MVLIKDIRLRAGREAYERRGVKIAAVHVHGADAAVFVGRIVVNAALRAAAGGIDRDLVLARFYLTAAAYLLHGAENVEKLADALLFRTAGNGIHPSESGPDKTGLRG